MPEISELEPDTRSESQRVGPNSTENGLVLPHRPADGRPRRFEPEVIDTDSRSFRRRETEPRSYRGGPSRYSTRNGRGRMGSPLMRGASTTPESRFSYASLLRRQRTRRHSFQVPDLPTISSTLDEGAENAEALSALASSESGDDSTEPSNSNERRRESCGEPYYGYSLSISPRSAQKQLKEQALAAFPNEQAHEPVDHFVVDWDEDEDLGHTKFRRASSPDLPWALEHMRQHKEQAEMRNEAEAMRDQPPAAAAAASRHGIRLETNQTATPPMLGEDLVFPQSMSPEGTMYAKDIDTGLWGTTAKPGNDGGGGGLWMGTCNNGVEEKRSKTRKGSLLGIPTLEPAPVTTRPNTDDDDVKDIIIVPEPIDEGPETEDVEMEDVPEQNDANEFHDGFVTQIYNYLSLGYPCVARYYDYELSEISGIPVQELRRDDLRTDAKGYAGITHNEARPKDVESKCRRWMALRLYIQEFARQTRRSEGMPTVETWGTLERKGSWAV